MAQQSDSFDSSQCPQTSAVTILLRQVMLEHKGVMTANYYEDAYYRLLWQAYRIEIDNRELQLQLKRLGGSAELDRPRLQRKAVATG